MQNKKAFVMTDAGPMVFDINIDTKTIQAKLRPATQEELDNELTDAFVNKEDMPVADQIGKEVNAAIRETLDGVRKGVKKFIMTSMGFREDSWNRCSWELDHCNGRSSLVGDYVQRRAQEIIQELDIPAALALTEKEKENIRAHVHKQVIDSVQRMSYHQYYEPYQKAFKEEIEKIAKEAVEPLREEIRRKAIETLYGPK